MIKRVLEVKNTGKLEDCGASPEFGDVTLIFAENARGKTTLSEIFRSVGVDKPLLVSRRKTAGSDEDQKIEILLEDNTRVTFEDDDWSPDISNYGLHVYNSKFVEDNVISGFQVDSSHEKNLYDFACGPEARELSAEIENTKKELNKLKNPPEESDVKQKIKDEIGDHFDVEEYVDLESLDVEELKKQLEREQQLLGRAENQKNIKSGDSLSILNTLELPVYFNQIKLVLGKSIDGIEQSALEQIEKRKEALGFPGAETWLRQGHDHAEPGTCPYCEQSTENVALIEAYAEYFSGEVQRINAELDALKDDFDLLNIENFSASNNSKIKSNLALFESLWFEHLEEDGLPEIDSLEKLKSPLDELFERIARKQENPISSVGCEELIEEIEQKVRNYNESIEAYNATIENVNEQIEEIQKNIPDKDDQEKLVEKIKLQIMRLTDENIIELCEQYEDLCVQIQEMEELKEELQEKRNSVTESILGKYQSSINNLLGDFGTEIRIVEDSIRPTNLGGASRSSVVYSLSLHGEEVDTRNQRENCLWLEDVLSDGDKTTFGYSLFLSRLKSFDEDELEDSVVVIDDPVASYDYRRKNKTIKEIKLIAQKVKQVIVLSHNLSFLKKTYKRLNRAISDDENIVFSKIRRGQVNEWDAKQDWQSEEIKLIEKLESYLEGATSYHDARRAIRPVLEHNLKTRFKELRKFDSLGSMLGYIRSDGRGVVPVGEEEYNFLDHKNNFSSDVGHHGNEEDNEGELEDQIEETLEYIINPGAVAL